MKKELCPKSAFFNQRILVAFVLCLVGVFLALIGFGVYPGVSASAQEPGSKEAPGKKQQRGIISGTSYYNDVSPPLRSMAAWPVQAKEPEREADLAPKIPLKHVDSADPVVQNVRVSMLALLAPTIPAPIRQFDGIPFPGVGCNCAPPDANGAVGATQYVQMVNEAYQVFDKNSGASVLGPNSISSLWTGMPGVCLSNGSGDPVVLYDHIANRWVISQFAGTSVPTDECIAISTTNDATGTYNRYAFHLGSNWFNVPKLAVWPDGYYMSNDVLNAAGTVFLGTQAFAFDRTNMLAGMPATFVTPGLTPGAPSNSPFLPADIDGPNLPPAGAPESFVEFPTGSNGNTYRTWHFHSDFATPANTTFTLFANPAAAGYTAICPSTRACVPESGAAAALDAIGDRLMFRLAYRKFSDGHESVVGNFTVLSSGVAGIRWFELRGVTAGPVTVFQESTYQPDSTWRWMGSSAMDKDGNMAIGFSASSSTIFPQLRYAGRVVSDPINTLSQGEAHLYDGTGSQTGTGNRWGDYSSMSIDPVDDQTFWYTNEYYATTGTFNWRTRIGAFKLSTVPTNNIVTGGSAIGSAGPNGVLDPGETVTVALGVRNSGGPGVVCTTAATAGTLQATGGVTSPSGPQNYGALCSASPAVFRNFTFTVDPNLPCGSTVTASLVMTDGATNYGTLTYTFTTGNRGTIFAQNFDGVAAPALPVGWSSTATGVGVPWVTSTTTPNSAPNDAFTPDPSNIGDSMLVSPSFALPAGGARLSFKNNYATESMFDGMVLEFSINGGATYSDITSGGGVFITGGYNATISTMFSSPIGGRMAWSGNSGGYITSTIDMPASTNGAPNVLLKWRMASDNSTAATGVRIDDITISIPVCDASAAVQTVTSSADAGGICPGASCTLRQAIATAASGDTINFAAGLTTINLTSGELLINKNLIIKGPGANLLSVQRSAAAGNFRIFNIAPASAHAIISGLSLINGKAGGSAFPANVGGAILNAGSLVLADCTLSGNSATSVGGCIYNIGSSNAVVTLRNCTLSGNSTPASGGAILNAGYNGVAMLTLTNCTLNQNTAGQYGGAIYNDGTSSGNAQLTLTNCTLNQNTASLGAGGIYNDALNPGSSGVAILRLRNTILRAGAAGANLVNDGATIISDGHNLSSDAAGGPAGTGPGGFLNATGDKRNTDPQLDPAGLANNGGPTMTVALQATSPAINGGDDNLSPPTDQRGYVRNGISDIGSFEFGGALPPTLIPVCVSRKVHGSFVGDIPLPRSGALGVECRTGGASGIHQVIMTFPGTVTVTNASVTTGVGGVSSFSVSGPEVTVNLTGISNAQKIVIRLFGVSDGIYTNDVDVPLGVLLGDTSGNGLVNASDVSLTKLKSGQAVDSSNFRNDVNVNGSINASDVSSVKLKTGTALP